jgi:hypothetical protein
VDAPQVGEIPGHAVVLTIPCAEIDSLPEKQRNPAVMEHHGVEGPESPLEHKLHRAWEIISGRR